eukprot:CAMPEP_0118642448 /NCGR_PEP_ID=MMETSP0785-20121206/5838_1 /TAXON_ID=91992 /ORGANISM="Bolidomonas pacifica, Strain CCMP 1866" /LENGTH=477 /DNA_ID=CAMNT_0006533995 /DNA_START=88 /DNA_END=1518 /DNA_ORIENTATION=-
MASPPHLERNPLPPQNSDIGPAQFMHEITHLGGLPAHRENKGIRFRQDPELPEGVSRRALPMVDQGTIKQGVAIDKVSADQQYPIHRDKVNSLGRQVESRHKSAGSIVFNATENPLERYPPPEPNNDLGPAQHMLQLTHTGGLPAQREQRGIKFRQDPELPEGVSRRALPMVDQGTLKQGVAIDKVSADQQYPIRRDKVNSLGRQIDSRHRSAGSITMSLPNQDLDRCPAPEPNNDLGPAQYLLQLTHTGGLPAYRENKGIRFRQDPELPEGISRRALPMVDQGTIKQGVPISEVAPYQQYPLRLGSSMGRQVLSTCKSAGSITMSRKIGESSRAPPPVTADTNGPAQFNLSQSIGTMPPYNPKVTTMTKRQLREKGNALFRLSLPKNNSISDWLVEHGKTDLKIKKARGTGKLVTSTGYGGKKKIRKKAKDPNEDDDYVPPDKRKSAKDEIKSIAEWLKKNGEPSRKNIFKAEFEH